jgi:hypothetical protein
MLIGTRSGMMDNLAMKLKEQSIECVLELDIEGR